ncbi:MAG: hypothetical protein K2N34_03460 [Lachnospiraceae bacterium]|nr:hypothetical protein [Lachnospiraceae bacterium]
MKTFEFTGLKILHEDMKKKKEKRATFPFEYNKKNFSCIFLTDMTPYRLYLTTLGKNPEVYELEIKKGYLVACYMDDYKRLVAYLELKYDPNHKFVPRDFFEALNKKIPKEFQQKPLYMDVIRVASKRRDIEEPNKIYFCGWRRNPNGKSVSENNYEKTRNAFGEEIARMSKSKNISSCWTDNQSEEEIGKLNEIVAMK